MTFFEAEIIEVFQESKRGKIGCTIDIDPFQNMFFFKYLNNRSLPSKKTLCQIQNHILTNTKSLSDKYKVF